MHWTIKTAALALVFAQVAGCHDAASPPPTAPVTSDPALSLAGDMQVQRPRVDVTAWED